MQFDEDRARSLIGKHIIIGVTLVDYYDSVVEVNQMHGEIVRVDRVHGVVVKLHDSGEEYTLPPDLSAIEEAPQGEYRFRSTGEVVVNPDLMTSWTIRQPDPDDETLRNSNEV